MSLLSPFTSLLMDDKIAASERWLVWIDGTGAFLICTGDRVTLGGTSPHSDAADIALLANLSRSHATIVRSGEGYVLEANGPVKVRGREVQTRTHLSDGADVELGRGVRLRFRLPNALSTTARLEFLSDHRLRQSIDGVILMGETCVLGPRSDAHIQCADWPDSVLLFQRNSELVCKSSSDLCLGSRYVGKETGLSSGDIISGSELRFRLEAVQPYVPFGADTG